MKVYAYRSKREKSFMICAEDITGATRVLKAWYKDCEVDFSTHELCFELITLEVEEESP